jgi:hypothetical protein
LPFGILFDFSVDAPRWLTKDKKKIVTAEGNLKRAREIQEGVARRKNLHEDSTMASLIERKDASEKRLETIQEKLAKNWQKQSATTRDHTGLPNPAEFQSLKEEESTAHAELNKAKEDLQDYIDPKTRQRVKAEPIQGADAEDLIIAKRTVQGRETELQAAKNPDQNDRVGISFGWAYGYQISKTFCENVPFFYEALPCGEIPGGVRATSPLSLSTANRCSIKPCGGATTASTVSSSAVRRLTGDTPGHSWSASTHANSMKDQALGAGMQMVINYLKTGQIYREFCIGNQSDCDAENFLKAIPTKVQLNLKVCLHCFCITWFITYISLMHRGRAQPATAPRSWSPTPRRSSWAPWSTSPATP